MLACGIYVRQTICMSKNLPPIQAWFVNRQVPFGSAPKHIKEQWVDVPLPLRRMGPAEGPTVQIGHGLGDLTDVHIVDDAMEVYTFDAVKALDIFGKAAAADFWEDMLPPEQVLIFDGSEGQVYPPAVIQRLLPGIELFDQADIPEIG